MTPLANAFERQAQVCLALGAPLCGELARRCARDIAARGPLARLLEGWPGEPLRDALPLRLLGAVHALVLAGAAPELAAHYPSAGGAPRWPRLWTAFVAVLEAHAGALRAELACAPQTNEIARACALLGGFLEIAAASGLQLRVFELGASAGLLQLWPRLSYRLGAHAWGDAGSLVQLACAWHGETPRLEVQPIVQASCGCDCEPVDLRDPEQRLRLLAWVWPDHTARLARLRHALALAAREPPLVERAPAGEWVPRRVAPAPSTATVVFHAVVWPYLGDGEQGAITEHMEALGARASRDAPLSWLRLEDPASGPASGFFELRLRSWPGGGERLLARSDPHGGEVWWVGDRYDQ